MVRDWNCNSTRLNTERTKCMIYMYLYVQKLKPWALNVIAVLTLAHFDACRTTAED